LIISQWLQGVPLMQLTNSDFLALWRFLYKHKFGTQKKNTTVHYEGGKTISLVILYTSDPTKYIITAEVHKHRFTEEINVGVTRICVLNLF